MAPRRGEEVTGCDFVKAFFTIPSSFVLDLLSKFPEQTVMDGVADGSVGLDQQMLFDSALYSFCSLAKESIVFFICGQMAY